MEKTFQIYYTSDTHGHVFPVSYASNSPENAGLLNLAAQVEKDGNTLVLDGGDALQGTPLTQYYLEHRGEWPIHPVAAAFNAMGLDYFTLGNHDFNFGYEALREYLEAMDGVCLCTNVEDLGGQLRIRPWAVHTLANGLRVGITGVVTDFVNVWEQPQNLERIRITDAFQAAQLPDDLIVRPLPDTLEVKFSALDFPGKVRNVFSLSEGHAEALQLLNPGSEDGSGIHRAELIPHPLPDGRLRFRGDLLADDVVYHRRKEVGIHFPLDVSRLCDDRCHPLVSCAQIRRFRFAVLEIHLSRLLSIQPFVCSQVVDLIITERTKFCNIKAPCQKAER